MMKKKVIGMKMKKIKCFLKGKEKYVDEVLLILSLTLFLQLWAESRHKRNDERQKCPT